MLCIPFAVANDAVRDPAETRSDWLGSLEPRAVWLWLDLFVAMVRTDPRTVFDLARRGVLSTQVHKSNASVVLHHKKSETMEWESRKSFSDTVFVTKYCLRELVIKS